VSVDFDTYQERYREEVAKSISFSGQDVDFFAEVKADALRELARRRLGDPRELAVLDVGCGVGVTDRHLDDDFRELHGVDITPGVIEQARRANPGVRYEVYDGDRLPYDDGRFHLAFTICVLHHIPPPQRRAFMAEVARVVRPGGLAVIFEHNPLNPLTRRAVDSCEFDADAVLMPRRESAALLTGAGLEIVARPYITFFPFGGARTRSVERRLGWLPLGAQYFTAGRR